MEGQPLKLQHQQLLVTIYGLYGAASDGSIAVSALVELLGKLEVQAPAARSTISRLKRNGTLIHERIGTETRYRLSTEIMDAFHEDDQRIFSPQRSAPGDPWSLVTFSVPEEERNRRYQLRSELMNLGFGAVGAGVAIGPSMALDQAVRRLEQRDLAQYVEYFRAEYLTDADIKTKVPQWWDLDALDADYAQFLDLYADAPEAWRARAAAADTGRATDSELAEDAFSFYIPLLTRWRRFPYRDPNLPLEFLPADWKAPSAKRIFLELHALLAPLARQCAYSVLGASGLPAGTEAIQENVSGQ